MWRVVGNRRGGLGWVVKGVGGDRVSEGWMRVGAGKGDDRAMRGPIHAPFWDTVGEP